MESFTCLRNSSHDWSLKDDDALLHILENIHKDIIEKAANINERYNERQVSLNEAYISLLNTNNRFLELSNTQFIENKVQEDDIDFDMIDINDKVSKSIDEDEQDISKLNIDRIILNSLNILAENCEKIHISDTESCSEDIDTFDDDYNVILQPKDFYDQRLPYIIGSKKWHKKWHIGLEEYSSQSEAEDNVSNDESEFSSSDESIKDDNDTSNQSFGGMVADKNDFTSYPFENNSFSDQSSLYKNSTQKIITQDNDEIIPSVVEKPSDFAAELSKKFNSQTSSKSLKNDKYNLFDEKKYEPNIKKPSSKLSSVSSMPSKSSEINIFSDEPPPLEKMSNEDDKSISSISEYCNDYTSNGSSRNSPNIFSSNLRNTNKEVIFSDSRDDIRNVNMDIENDNNYTESSNRNLLEEKDNNKQEEKVKPIPKNKPVTLQRNNATMKSFLFEDSEDDDNDIFGFSQKNKGNDTVKQQIKENIPIKKSTLSVSKSDKSMSLFDHSSDSDNDLFSIIKNKEDSKTNKAIIKENFIKTNILVQDNIFNSTENKVKRQTNNKATTNKQKENNNATYKTDETCSKRNVEESHEDNFTESQNSHFDNVLFDDVPPPLNDIDDDVDDIFSNIKNFGDTITSNYDDIFGDNLFNNSDKRDNKKNDIFSDIPPEYHKDDYVTTDDNHSSSDNLYNDNDKDSLKTHISKEFSINVQSDTANNSFVENEFERNAKNTINNNDNKKFNISSTHIITGDLFREETVKRVNIEHQKENNEKIKTKILDSVLSEDRSKQVSKNVSGKIQSNIVIDVKALLPGNKTVKKINENIEKLKNNANEDDNNIIIDHDDTDSKNMENNDNKSPTLSDKVESSILCNDMLKDRVKIQVKRKPSSRKARHEAIKSTNNVLPKKDVFSDSVPNLHLKDDVDVIDNKDLKVESSSSTILVSGFEKNDKDKLKNEVKSTINFNKGDNQGNLFSNNKKILENAMKNEKNSTVTLMKKKTVSIFEDSDSDSDLFVKGKKKEKPPKNTFQKKTFASTVGKSLFDDDDSDDLFSTQCESMDAKTNMKQKEGSLFEDSDSDIFKPEKESKHKTTTSTKSHQKKKTPKSNLIDNETHPSFEDPLSLFLSN